MDLTMDDIKSMFPTSDYARGLNYFNQRRVISMREVEDDESEIRVECVVRGSQAYNVMFRQVDEEYIHAKCSCPRFRDFRSCKHLVAAMIAYLNKPSKRASYESDWRAQNLLQNYMKKSQSVSAKPAVPARLVPQLEAYYLGREEYPSFSFRVGRDKLYVVKNVKEFLSNVNQGKSVVYGKNLTLEHSIEQFDSQSQQIITMLMNEYEEFRTMDGSHSAGSSYYYRYHDEEKNEVRFTGLSFDRWFELFFQQSVESRDGGKIYFTEGNPEVTIRLDKQKNYAVMRVETNEPLHFFGSRQQLYALGKTSLLRCSPDFMDRVYPLLRSGSVEMMISFRDLPTFCSCVLPEVEDYVTVEDPDGLLQEYLPDECTPRFYFDIDEEALTLKLNFRYGDTELPAGTSVSKMKGIKRDLKVEQMAVALAEHNFHGSNGQYYLFGEDAQFDFLTGELEKFHQYGEVYISERLRKKRIQSTGASVGISVSDGMLTLDLDTGEFPPEELAALYQSLLKRKKYHRLKDGRYLEINGSPFEKMAEMAQMLQLQAKDLTKGEVKLPAFRALYLDDILADNEGLQVTRDRQFRAMVRNFKSVKESDYSLPENMEKILRPYQKVGFRWLKTLESCGFGGILADEMGLGKTLQMIAFLSSINREEVNNPSLIVCPASLILNWGEELQKFAPELKCALIMGNAAERKNLRREAENADVWVTSYELLRQDMDDYRKLQFYCCVLDEGQHIKNQSTLVSKAVKQVNCSQRFVLTGTPIENRLSELWNLFDFLMPGYLFSHTAFVEKLEKPIIKSNNAEAAAQLRKLVQPFLMRRLKKDVLRELPPKTEHIRRIPLSEEERKVYLSAVQATKDSMDGGQGKLQVLAALTQLRQICCDPNLCFENYEGQSSKLDACMELCAGMVENGHQILLFSQFTSMLDRIRQRLDQMGISSFTLQGSTPKEKRAQLVKAFNAGRSSVFLISLKAGGTGLNLTAADVVIHFDPWWNLAAQDQATDRAHRIGQQSHVQVYKLITKDTIEEKILNLQDKKAALMDAISGATEGGILTMSKEELLALLD